MNKVKFVNKIILAKNISSFIFTKPQDFSYTAGQYIEITLPHDDADDRGIKRWFTLSSSPNEDFLAITTKFATQNGSSFKNSLKDLPIGIEVTISDAMGDFVLPINPEIPILMVAGGIGITPVRSMFAWLNSQNQKRKIKVIYGVNNEEDIVFKRDIESLADLEIVVSNSTSWQCKTGMLNSPMIYPEISQNQLVFLSGPEPMVEQLSYDLKLAGVKPEKLVTDFFPGYTNL